MKSLREIVALRSTRGRHYCCLLPLVLTTGSFNLSNFYVEANLHWIVIALLFWIVIALLFLSATGIVVYLRQNRQHDRDTAELIELRASNVAHGEDEQRFRDQLAETRIALEVAHVGTFGIDLTTGTITWSAELYRIYGLKPGEFGGRLEDWVECVLPEDRSRVLAEYQSNSAHGSRVSSKYRIRRRNDGEVRWLEASGQVIFSREKRRPRMVGINTDVTEQKEEMRALEEQYRHGQKMEAVGRLAGGVAHDFNNLVMVIRSFAELIQEGLPAGESLHKCAQEILNASTRAAGLTAQLLAFSRKRILNLTVLDLNAVINDATKMLKRLIGEDINVQVLADKSIGSIRADADQIVQILMNLCVNARDAMPQGGTITIQICNGTVGERGLPNNAYMVSGAYVVLSIEDTGVGMSKQDMEHMFDPFFTTKPVGGGTGLGLSTVYGIVKQSNGYVWADSELGKGTRFNLYFPRTNETVPPRVAFGTETTQPCGTETVLVVEDETPIRESICEFLRQRGYTVLSANTGEQALLISGRFAGTIDLLITDLVLPRMGGQELSRRLTDLQPKVKVIYMSGDADRSALNIYGQEHAKAFLLKPFSLSKLAQTIQDVLKPEGRDSESRSA